MQRLRRCSFDSLHLLVASLQTLTRLQILHVIRGDHHACAAKHMYDPVMTYLKSLESFLGFYVR